MKSRLLRPIALIIGTISIASVVVSILHTRPDDAPRILADCSKEVDIAKCYEREVPNLYPSRPVSVIFDVIREIRRKDPKYQFCHVLAHKLGEAVVLEDTSKWISAIPYNPGDGLCSNGFIHGVIIGRFRNSVLSGEQLEAAVPELKRACEPHDDWHPARLDQAICYHGMGHLFDYITDADLKKSVSLCTRVAQSPSDDFTNVCKAGVFMQIYQPLEPDDFALIKHLPVQPNAKNYKDFCATYRYDPIAEGACLHEAWPLFRESILSGKGVKEFCSEEQDISTRKMCYETASSIVGRLLLEHQDKIIAACNEFPEDGQAICFRATAQADIEEDRTQYQRALDICHQGGTNSGTCLEGLAQRATFIFGSSPEKHAFCKALPQSLRETCER